jgi:hypothetical protein
MSASRANRARRASLLLCLLVLLNACAVVRTPEHRRIALFAPFEGRYREVGYNALYAARLTIAETSTVDLLAVDSGGTEAANHAKALAQDPLVVAAIVLGYDGTSPDTLKAFNDIPVLIVGDWGAKPIGNNVFIFSNPQIDQQLTVSSRISVTDAAQIASPLIGGDVFALEGFTKLRTSLEGVTVLSSGYLLDSSDPIDADFIRRYKANDPFAPTPGLLASLTDYATWMAIFSSGAGSRPLTQHFLATSAFTNGYWNDAQIHRYHYVNGLLTEDIVK